ncbi:MAG: MBL fold metallo-hydrolase [Blautia sp.]|nr:MBL fold metallo-hydrolase [Blautia sp.]
MSRKASQFQKKVMSLGYRGKEIFKPLNTGWIDEHVSCIREWIANIFFYTKNGTTIMIDAGYNYDRLEEKMGWLDIEPAQVRHILITHQDTDHVGAVERDSDGLFREAALYLSEIENRYLTGEVRRKVIFGAYKLPMVVTDNRKVLLKDGDVFYIDDIKVEAILVPGHTWGHMVYLVDDAYLFTGDTIWFGPDGGYSFINSLAEDNELAKRSLEKLEKILRDRNLSPKVITGHTGWSQNLDFVFAHREQVCNSLKKQKPHDPTAPYDGYDESEDTESRARNVRLPSVNDRKKRKVLLFGAGVIGAYLAHVLIQAGNEVTILAREERAQSLKQNGLVIRHHLQKKTTKDMVEAVTDVNGRSFDATFVVMPYHKIQLAMPQIAQLQTKLLVLVGNDLAPAKIEAELAKAPGIKKVLFGFQVSGGKKEADHYVCERFGGSWMDLGQLHGNADPRLKKWTERLFAGTSYKLNWQEDMEAYLICHPAAILPIAYLSYICDGDLRTSTMEQRRMMVNASHEAYEALKAKGIPIYPKGDDQFYEGGVRGKGMQLLYLVMAKSKIGDLIACEHCRNAVSEMEQIDLFYEELLKDYPSDKLKTWNRLRGMMPSWEELHRKYGS